LLNRSVFGIDFENTILISRQRVDTTNASMWNGCRSRARRVASRRAAILVGQKIAATIEEICREEPASPRDKCATIIRHAAG
jgi:hypothetical protein